MLNRRLLARRWAHLLVGGALLMPFFLLTSVVIGLDRPDADVTTHLGWQFLAFGLALPLVAVAGLFPRVRPLEAAAVRALATSSSWPPPADGPAGWWAARRRTASWCVALTALGGLVSGASLALPPAAGFLVAMPFVGPLRRGRWAEQFPALVDRPWLAPPVGLAVLVALVAVVAGAGALLARLAPALLGPTPADRLAAAERRAADLAVRNRLARELHDSVGHALSAVTLQAGAARTVLGSDPGFAREALVAIEETARQAVAELDTVLGLLRDEDPAGRGSAPTLADLDGLLDRVRAAGLTVRLVDGLAAGRRGAAGSPGGRPRGHRA
ncbi:sensor histidine kinase [Streptomyces mayteni]